MDHFFIWTLRSLSKIHYEEEELEEADDEQEGKGMISVRANLHRIKFNGSHMSKGEQNFCQA